MSKETIALIELGGSHDECLLSQVLALKSVDVNILLVLDTKTANRNTYLISKVNETLVFEHPKNAIKSFLALNKLAKTLKNKGVTKMVFNTAQGGHVRNLTFLLSKKITCYGIIHTIKKFEGSFTQNFIFRRVKRFLVLSDDLLKKAKTVRGIHVESFYPLDFQLVDRKIQKTKDEVWITIPGEFETRRKDIGALLSMIEQSPENARFILLGKAKKEHDEVRLFFEQLETSGQSHKLISFDHFVEETLFLDYVQQSDFLLPLIHPATQSAEEYIHRQISGAFSLAYSFAIPLLIHKSFADVLDFQYSAAFYEPQSFETDLAQAIQQQGIISKRIQSVVKWQAANRHEKYVRFLGV